MHHHSDSRCENCIVRQFNSLKALSKEELKRISDSKVSKKVKKGETIFNEGERLNGVFCVRSGISKMSKLSENGKDTIIRLASKGEVLGERSVLADEVTNLSVVALNDMEVCFIPKAPITDSVNNNPHFTKAILLHMAKELKFADNLIANMAQKTIKQRLAETLLYLDTNFGTDAEGYLALVITREDIANIVGTVKEACIRTLTQFKNEGLIDTEGKRIQLLNKKALHKLTEGL